MNTKDWALMPEIVTLLDRLQEKLIRFGVHDNQRCQGIWLKLYIDGSGAIMGEYSDARQDETPGERLVRTVCTMKDHELAGFNTIAELHGDLVAMTMRVNG